MKTWTKLSSILMLSAILFTSSLAAYPVNSRIGRDSSGNAVAVWEVVDSPSSIQSSYWDGSTWTSPVDVISDPLIDSNSPIISVNASGDAVAIWRGYDSLNGVYSLYAAMRDSGTWGSPVAISANDQEVTDLDYQVHLSDAGDIIATWSAFNWTSMLDEIRANNATISGGTWGTDVQIDL